MRISFWRFVLIVATAVSLIGYPKPATATTFNVTVGPGGMLVFDPDLVTIHPGDQVKWTWDSGGHSTTSGSPGMPDGIWDSGIHNGGATFTRTFNSVGTFHYYCVPHSCCGMVGTVTVVNSTHPVFFDGETALGGGFYYLQFGNGTPFGYYSYLSDQHFIYHIDLGFEYLLDANDANHGIYFYDFASNSFFYTSPSAFPNLYDFSLNAWLYYLPDVNNPGRYTHNPRWFYNFATGQWITL